MAGKRLIQATSVSPHVADWRPSITRDETLRKRGTERAMTHNLIIEQIEVVPGILPDGTHVGKFLIETANLGNLEWILTPGRLSGWRWSWSTTLNPEILSR
jgi:hypothetical protein